jgi:SAM-dependent methyltransferase
VKKDDYARFETLSFDDFKQLARDPSLSRYEKIGFPNSYREGKEAAIFEDITRKLPMLHQRGLTVLDIGPGCSELPSMMIDLCRRNGHRLILVDSPEMLERIPDEAFIQKVPGRFPEECQSVLNDFAGSVHVLLTYSVFHYVFADQNPIHFIDQSIRLLAPGGRMLIGDVPNVSKRKRFFASANGVAFHQAFTGTTEHPRVDFNIVEPGRIDDAFLLAVVMRCRSAGFDAYVLPQSDDLPLANRREDILIARP